MTKVPRRGLVAVLLLVGLALCLSVTAHSVGEPALVCDSWRNVVVGSVRIEDGALPESRAVHRAATESPSLWVKPFTDAGEAALFREEDAAADRWAAWQQKLLDVRILAAEVTEALSEEKEKESIPGETVVLFDNILRTHLSDEAIRDRQGERDALLTVSTSPDFALRTIQRQVQTLRDALAVQQLVEADRAASSGTPEAVLTTLLQDQFPGSFAVASHLPSRAIPVGGPRAAILQRTPIAFPAVVSPEALARFTAEGDAITAVLEQILVKYNDSSDAVAAVRAELSTHVQDVVARSAAFVDALDALARPLCHAVLATIEDRLAQIQALLFDPDGRPRGHPDAAELKAQKSTLRRWRKSITALHASRPPGARRRRSSADKTAQRLSPKQASRSVEDIATAMALVAKYRLGDSHARLPLPSFPAGSSINGVTIDEVRTHVAPPLLYAFAFTLVLSLGLFELRLLCLRRVVAERRLGTHQETNARAPRTSTLSHKALTCTSVALFLCPWVVTGAVVTDRVRQLSVDTSVMLHFTLNATGVRWVLGVLIFTVLSSSLVSFLVRLYASLVHSVQPKAKAD